MQQAVVINTLSFAKKLRVAGFNDEQAEIQAEAINDVLIDFQDKRLEELVTKGDLKATSADLRTEILEVRTEIAEVKIKIAEVRTEIAEVRTEISEVRTEISEVRTEISKTESRLIKWGVGLFVVQFAALAALIKLF